jgi:integrase
VDDQIAALDSFLGIPPWTFHDLRRTVATGCQQLGVPIDHTEALLNHTGRRAGLVSVYQVYEYRDEKAAAVEKWGSKVLALV